MTTNQTAEKLMQKLIDTAENTEKAKELPEAVINEQTLVIYHSKMKSWFYSFKADGKPRWTKDIFKAAVFPYPSNSNVELKMNIRLLANSGVDIGDIYKFKFEYKVTGTDVSIGPIGNSLNKKTDIDNV